MDDLAVFLFQMNQKLSPVDPVEIRLRFQFSASVVRLVMRSTDVNAH
jgi:hypothetical protein